MNSRINVFGRTIPTWFLVATMVGAGSLAIATQGGAVHQEDPPDIQHSSDVKIHLQDVDGKVITNVPISASRAFSPLPVEFSESPVGKFGAAGTLGSEIVTKQKIVANLVLDVSEDVTVEILLDNNSEDDQIFLIKASAPPHVIIDAEGDGAVVHGLTGHNEWLASIEGTAGGGCAGTLCEVDFEISTTDAGFYPIVVELLRVG